MSAVREALGGTSGVREQREQSLKGTEGEQDVVPTGFDKVGPHNDPLKHQLCTEHWVPPPRYAPDVHRSHLCPAYRD